MIAAINQSSSVNWLSNYASSKAIGYPFVYDNGGAVHKDYQVGAVYGNTPPTFIIVDQWGTIRYRIDDQFNKAAEMATFIQGLITGGSL